MPIAKSIAKLQQKKSTQSLHPKGRKFKQIQSALHRENKLDKKKLNKSKLEETQMEKFIFAQEAMNLFNNEPITKEQLNDVCEKYIYRNKPELDELESDHAKRGNRPPSNKLLNLRTLYENELRQFEHGFEFVDLTDAKTVENLKNWNRSWGGLNMLKTTVVKKE